MSTFFTVESDSALLHSSIRSHAEVANVVSDVEDDIIRHYSDGASVATRYVHLEGYNQTTPGSSDSSLKDALKRTIADVVSHRLRYYDEDATATSESRGSRSISRQVGALDPLWNEGWSHRLSDFDVRPVFFGV